MEDINMNELFEMIKATADAKTALNHMKKEAENDLNILAPCVMKSNDTNVYAAWLRIKAYLELTNHTIESFFDGYDNVLKNVEDDIIRGED